MKSVKIYIIGIVIKLMWNADYYPGIDRYYLNYSKEFSLLVLWKAYYNSGNSNNSLNAIRVEANTNSKESLWAESKRSGQKPRELRCYS